MLEKDLFELNGIINRLTGEFHTLMSLSWYIRVMSSVVCWIIGASLSEPHIDHDNVPRRGECLYLSIYVSGRV